MNDRAERLIKNISMIGIGSIITKLTQFVILSLCTYWMSTDEYGIADICVSTSTLLLPIFSLNISQAVFRFAEMDNKSGLISLSLIITLVGSAISFIIYPLANQLPNIGSYWLCVSFLLLFESLCNLFKEYTRGLELVKEYTLGGCINSFAQIIFCILFLCIIKMGIWGYILTICLGYFSEIAYLIISTSALKYLSLRFVDKRESRKIIDYALPLIPNSIMWWIVSISDRYFILYMLGETSTGIYAVSAKIPALITVVTSIFFKAWEMTAIKIRNDKDKEEYNSSVYQSLWVICAIAIACAFLFLRIFLKVFVSEDFFVSWQYGTVLLSAAGFSALQSFVGTSYTVEKDSIGCLKTTSIMALINIVLNFILISVMGLQGATIATLSSYMFVLFYRIADTKKYVRLSIDWIRFGATYMIIVIESLLLPLFEDMYYVIVLISIVSVFVINFQYIRNNNLGVVYRLVNKRG